MQPCCHSCRSECARAVRFDGVPNTHHQILPREGKRLAGTVLCRSLTHTLWLGYRSRHTCHLNHQCGSSERPNASAAFADACPGTSMPAAACFPHCRCDPQHHQLPGLRHADLPGCIQPGCAPSGPCNRMHGCWWHIVGPRRTPRERAWEAMGAASGIMAHCNWQAACCLSALWPPGMAFRKHAESESYLQIGIRNPPTIVFRPEATTCGRAHGRRPVQTARMSLQQGRRHTLAMACPGLLPQVCSRRGLAFRLKV